MSQIFLLWASAAWSLVFSLSLVTAQPVMISELMYHPLGTNVLEQWLELHNSSAVAVDISGWAFTKGVHFTIPASTVLSAGGFLVVAADKPTFLSNYPGTTPVVGGWTGKLGFGGDTIELRDATNRVAFQMTYATEGDWASRRLAAADSYGKRGWEWHASHDGEGRSMELVNEQMSLDQGQNWAASVVNGGTPGAINSVATNNAAPLLTEVRHSPAVPKSTDSVTISTRLLDELADGFTAVLHWRVDTATSFATTPMEPDPIRGAGVMKAVIPPHSEGSVIEFYLVAQDKGGHQRTYPNFEPAPDTRSPYLVFQVDNSVYSGSQPLYQLVVSRLEKVSLEQVWGTSPDSDAEANGTFLYRDGLLSPEGTPVVRYQAGFRNRGHGTRTSVPHNFRVNVPNDRPWQGRAGINLNSQYTVSQTMGSAVFRSIGIPMAESRLVQMRWNGVNLAGEGAPQFGSYAANELVDGLMVKRQFPDDSAGNLYRGIRDAVPGADADLVWHGSLYTGYTNAYFKQNNSEANDWADVIHLIDVLNNTPANQYLAAVTNVLQVREWMRYFAANTLLDNQETCLATGIGDDFAMYRGTIDTRVAVLPYDMDSLLGQGKSVLATQTSIFKMADLPVLNKLVKHPAIAPVFYQELRNLAQSFFETNHFSAFIAQLRVQFENTPAIQTALRNTELYEASRLEYVLSQIPSSLTATSSLPVVSGYPKSTSATVILTGSADAARTAAVKVNGELSVYSPWQGKWTNAAVALLPGINRVLVQAFDTEGVLVDEVVSTLWRDDGSTQNEGGTVAANTTWTAAGGPYLISTSLTIASGATLTIEPGTTVYLGTGVNLTVANGGRLMAEGTADSPIILTRAPGATALWGGIVVDGSVGSPETRLVHTHIEGNASTAIHSSGGTLFLDYLTFGTTDKQYISLDDSSFVVSHCLFPTPTASFEPNHGTGGIKQGGHGLFLRNFYGAPTGYNDVVDFTGGNRPGQAIVHFIENVVSGSGDDGFDLDGTDAWVEGNIFLHVHRNGAPDSSSAISGGNTGADTSEITAINNLFYDCDNAATAKQGNFFSFFNNTIVHITKVGGVDFASSVVNIRDTTPDLTTEGKGYYLEGNIISDVAGSLVRNPDPAVAPVTFNNNLLPVPWVGFGESNVMAEPMFVKVPKLAETYFTNWASAQILRDWLTIQSGSEAVGSGPFGVNKGYSSRIGVLIPDQIQSLIGAKLQIPVGILRQGHGIPTSGFPEGTGYTHYKWRLDSGVWSPETIISQPIVLDGLTVGLHEVEVSGRRDTGLYQDDPIFGEAARTSICLVQVITEPAPGLAVVRLNEVLAINQSVLTNGLTTPDLVELFNSGSNEANLSGLSMTDDQVLPRKFVFPLGTLIPAGGYLVLFADSETNSPGLHLGFKIKSSGGSLTLLSSNGLVGTIIDSVTFGIQAPDWSIGRGYDGEWTLCHPTFGAANTPAATGDPSALRINEWLASSAFSSTGDFVEFFNSDTNPVAMGGLLVSDATTMPARHVVADLSFIAGYGHATFQADGAGHLGADHLGFKLGADFGMISLKSPDGTDLDTVVYGTQRTDVSQGRSPDGTVTILSFAEPTPGGPNPGGTLGNCTLAVETVPLLPLNATWRYNQTANLDGTAWKTTSYNDSAWPSGKGILAHEDCNCLPAPGIGTQLSLGRSTYYFRTQFVVTNNLANFALNMTTVLDDGAIIYLNGTEILRVGMAAGTTTYAGFSTRNVSDASAEFFSLPGNVVLLQGTNTLAVEVHQTSAASSDVTWGAAMEATLTVTNCSGLATTPVILNEVLARNVRLTNLDGTIADWIELYNPSTNAVALGGISLTDDSSAPRKWVFPADASIVPMGFVRITCNPLMPASVSNAVIVLDGAGGSLFLFDNPSAGGALLDAVHYGVQAADYSIGRIPDGSPSWLLTVPTPASANSAAALGDASALKVNEWMADPSTGDDWFELYNSDLHPVALGGLFLSDNLDAPYASLIPSLSFIGAGNDSYRQFFADGKPTKGPSHANFQLKKSGEAVGIFTAGGSLLDGVTFLNQQMGVSQGRYPDGTTNIVSMPGSSTPNAANSLVVVSDTDGDGIPDAWEIAHGLDPLNSADASADPDGDGFSNLQEYLAGTNPLDANSLLRVQAVVLNNQIILRVDTVAGYSYLIQGRSDVGAGSWTTLGEIPKADASGVAEFTDTLAASGEHFYRAQAKKP